MAKPAVMRSTPAAVVTAQIGLSAGPESEIWQLIRGGTLFAVYSNVPFELGQTLLQTPDGALDAAIRSQLTGNYVRRISS